MRIRAWWVRRVALVGLALVSSAPPTRAQSDGPLSLGDALAQARTTSPQLEAARTSAEGWRAAVDAWSGWDNPALELRSENFGFASASAGVLNDTFVVVSQLLPVGGRRRATREVLRAESLAAQHLLRPRELALDLEVMRRYLAALTARDLLDHVEAHAVSIAELSRVVASRVAAGAAAGSESARLRAELLRVQQSRAQAQAELGRRMAALGALVDLGGNSGATRLRPPHATIQVEATNEAATVESLVSTHPAVVESRSRIGVSQQAARFEEAVGRLQATAVGGYKKTSGVSTGVASVVVALPVFDANGVARARAESGVRLSSLAAAEAERAARAEMTALVAAARLLARALADEAPLESLEIVRAAARARLRESATDVLAMVDAERIWYDTRRDRLLLEHDARQAALEIQLRLGVEVQP